MDTSDPFVGLAREYLGALLRGERHTACALVLAAVRDDAASVKDIYLRVFQPCQHEIGRLWQIGQISVAQEHYCTAATQLVMSQLYPRLFASPRIGKRIVVTCIAGELHEVGARMVSDLLELEGWDAIYLGANTPAADVVRTIAEHNAEAVGISVTMTEHLEAVAPLIAAVRAACAGRSVKVVVGGHAFEGREDLWRQAGADGYAADAVGALALLGPSAAQRPSAAAPTRHGRSDGGVEPTTRWALPTDTALDRELVRLTNELATAQRELARRNNELVRLSRQKDELLGIAAHDLRNPLQAILGYSHILQEQAAPALSVRHSTFLERIEHSSAYMFHLVNDLLDVSTLETGRLTLRLNQVDLVALVRATTELNILQGQRKGIDLRLDLGADRMMLALDAPKIEQVLNNLLSNAIKFSPRDTAVDIRMSERDGEALITVTDHGPGIPDEEQRLLFQPFGTTSVSPTAGESSTGLGLAIAKRLVEGHAGRIWVESEVGRGTTFLVTLPRSPELAVPRRNQDR